MPFGLGPGELVLIFAILLLLFGAKRLPELAGGMGKGIRDFKRSLNGLDETAVQANAEQNYLQSAPPAAPVQTAQAAAPVTVEAKPLA